MTEQTETMTEALERTVQALEAEVQEQERLTQEARHDAVVAGLEAAHWECLALAKDEQMEAMRAHITALQAHAGREMGTVDLERQRVERAETPPIYMTGRPNAGGVNLTSSGIQFHGPSATVE